MASEVEISEALATPLWHSSTQEIQIQILAISMAVSGKITCADVHGVVDSQAAICSDIILSQ